MVQKGKQGEQHCWAAENAESAEKSNRKGV